MLDGAVSQPKRSEGSSGACWAPVSTAASGVPAAIAAPSASPRPAATFAEPGDRASSPPEPDKGGAAAERVSGDFYLVAERPQDSTVLVVGDVLGHGLLTVDLCLPAARIA